MEDPEHLPYPHTLSFDGYKKEIFFEKANRIEQGLPAVPRRGRYRGTIKLHGTNVTVIFRNSDPTTPTYQSRNRVITATSDNVGTVAFLAKVGIEQLVHKILEIRGITTFDSIIIAGEFAGAKIQQGVALQSMEKFFCIFSIAIDDVWVDMAPYASVAIPDRRVFNILAYKTWEVEIDLEGDTTAVMEEMTRYTKDVAVQCPFAGAFSVNGIGEGIVWTLIPEGIEFKGHNELFNFKTKGEDFATTTSTKVPKPKPDATGDESAMAFAAFALTERRLEQGLEYMAEFNKEIVKKNVPDFVKWVVEDTIREEGAAMKEMNVEEKTARKVLTNLARTFFLAKCTK